MSASLEGLVARVESLESRLRRAQACATVAILGLALSFLGAWSRTPQTSDVLRTHQLIVQDSAGHDRVVLGAPIPNPSTGKRRSAGTGIAINDATGFERFAVALGDDGNMNLGLDAPPRGGKTNPERIGLIANALGGAEFRVLNQDADVVAHLTLFNDKSAALFFEEHQPGKSIVHRIAAAGDTVISRP